MLVHCNVPAHECILHYSPAAAGECACPTRAADECIRRREGDKMAMRPFAKLLRKLVSCGSDRCSVQRRVHAELDRELTAGQPVTYDDRQRLPYVEAVVLEAMRLAPVVPLALPHFTDVDVGVSSPSTTGDGCELTIPAGSIVIANLWSVGRDPDVWNSDVDVFRPERFLRRRSSADDVTTVSGRTPLVASLDDDDDHFDPSSASTAGSVDEASGSRSVVVDARLTESFYPFSFGARRCVGESLGRRQIFIFFVSIMRSCRLLAVDGNPPPIDGETYGDVIRPAPYEIRILPR